MPRKKGSKNLKPKQAIPLTTQVIETDTATPTVSETAIPTPPPVYDLTNPAGRLKPEGAPANILDNPSLTDEQKEQLRGVAKPAAPAPAKTANKPAANPPGGGVKLHTTDLAPPPPPKPVQQTIEKIAASFEKIFDPMRAYKLMYLNDFVNQQKEAGVNVELVVDNDKHTFYMNVRSNGSKVLRVPASEEKVLHIMTR